MTQEKITELKVRLFDIDNQIKILTEQYKDTMKELNDIYAATNATKAVDTKKILTAEAVTEVGKKE